MSKLPERGAANESAQGWAQEARMQGYPWEGCLSLLCGLTVSVDPTVKPPLPNHWLARHISAWFPRPVLRLRAKHRFQTGCPLNPCARDPLAPSSHAQSGVLRLQR
eukprot:5781938-Pyramimonas_sp.AAC.1